MLISTKFSRPPNHPEFVERPRLMERLDKIGERRVTLVSAPLRRGAARRARTVKAIADEPESIFSVNAAGRGWRERIPRVPSLLLAVASGRGVLAGQR